ncbi:hypothetical protein [Mucilaginibacter sp. SG564]|uniref:hypothetical protein n=1 Tax=Mucilaginibacter sp. SG564 TaxID=2587022 RepID=UPI001555F428|nr:hypothetical protein [Mucilaginibacter sp. SG564]NOW95376.1 hypothetical protein [Mucilaginibacter sp. SG564]
MTNLDKYKADLEALYEKGVRLQLGLLKELKRLDEVPHKDELLKKYTPLNFRDNYEGWYTEALTVVNQLMPNRVDDFVKLYKNERRKEIDFLTYTISDFIIGLVTTRGGAVKVDGSAAFPKFQQQLSILKALQQRFTSSLFDIKQLVQADIFDTEIESAKELSKKGFFRAAGVICGVVIEKHLNQVCNNHKIPLGKKNPTIADFNDLLKNSNVVDVIVWRFIQRLADIRNLCGHNKDREPYKEEVEELIQGVDKIIKTIY